MRTGRRSSCKKKRRRRRRRRRKTTVIVKGARGRPSSVTGIWIGKSLMSKKSSLLHRDVTVPDEIAPLVDLHLVDPGLKVGVLFPVDGYRGIATVIVIDRFFRCIKFLRTVC